MEKFMKMKLFSVPKILVSLIASLAISALFQQDASAKNIFVSPSGNGTDGSSWANAVQDPSKIDWSRVVCGDQIILDGGASSITYISSLTVPKSNVVIRQSAEAGHNGQVILRGPLYPGVPVAVGLTITGHNVHVVGVRRSGIKIYAFAAQGASIKTNNNSLRNVEINSVTGFPPYAGGRVGGLTFGGYNNQFINCDFRDTTIGAVSQPVAGVRNMAVFRHCTFGTSGYGFFGDSGTALQGATTGGATVYADHCVFGPYVNYGVTTNSDNVHLSNCLFLSASKANLNVNPTSGTPHVTVTHCTIYEKKFAGGQPISYGTPEETILTNGVGTVKVSNTIVFGGTISVPPAQVINAGGNVQFAVSGNTVALAPSLVDPHFVDEAVLGASAPAATFIPRTLTSLNFAPKPGSPAVGKGSDISRVSDIVAPYGPTYGLPTVLGGP
jgi:hypothetical protein